MPEVVELLATALRLHKSGNLPHAERLYRQILQEDPQNADALHLLGVIAHQAGQHEVAIGLIQRAVAGNSLIPAFHTNLGNAYRSAGRLAEARSSYEQALKLDPNYADAHAFLGQTLRLQGQPADALEHIGQAIRIDPQLAAAHRNLAVLLAEQGHGGEALAALQEAVRLQSESAETHMALGDLHAELNHPDEAVACYRETLRRKPGLMPVYKKLGLQLLRTGKLGEAAALYKDALRFSPDDPDCHNNLGVVFKQQGRLVEAAVQYEAALRAKPDFAEAYNNLGSVCVDQGNLERGVQMLRKAMEYRPDYLQAQVNLGSALLLLGRPQEAQAQLEQVLKRKPNAAEVHWHLGHVYRTLNDTQTASRHLRRAVELDPRLNRQPTPGEKSKPAPPTQRASFRPHPKAVEENNRGVTLRNQGKPAEAIVCYQQALALQPDFALTHVNLGIALVELGRSNEAVVAYRDALRLEPENAVVHNNLGVILKRLGDRDGALHHYQEATRFDPTLADAHNNLGAMCIEDRKVDDAIRHYEQALRSRYDYPEAHNNLGVALKQKDFVEEAIAHYREALRFRPDFPECCNNFGFALLEEGRLDEAVECYHAALRYRPDYAEGHCNLSYIYTELGKPEEALKHCLESLRLKPDFGEAYCNLGDQVKQGRYKFSPEQIQHMEALVTKGELSPSDAGPLHFALAGIREKEGADDAAFLHYKKANDFKRAHFTEQGRSFDREHCRKLFDHIIATFTREHFARMPSPGLDSELPVFVVGMPRSGTTLVEQIMASHPQVHGAGELKQIQRLVLDLGKVSGQGADAGGMMSRVTPAQIRRQAVNHLDHLRRLGGDAARVVDKMPDNFAHLEFIWTLFPRTRIIHCRRDPIDTCLSCFVQNFRSITFATNLEDLAFYYQQYERLMAHWREVIPLRMYEVVYEELIDNQEAISRDLIRFLGLEWDERCLDFHKTERPVQTASKLQVRQPIYKTSMKRWKRYEAHLQPLIQALNYKDDWGKDLKSGEIPRPYPSR
ncbi:MAG: hypothetical protein C0467_20360 [Planctomycetaceae bacterium]|nr:hypothetical protein [Planctomycetaceae bacterium]